MNQSSQRPGTAHLFLIKVQKKETHKTAAQVACRLFCAEHTFICSEQKKETHRPAGMGSTEFH